MYFVGHCALAQKTSSQKGEEKVTDTVPVLQILTSNPLLNTNVIPRIIIFLKIQGDSILLECIYQSSDKESVTLVSFMYDTVSVDCMLF